MLRPDAVRPPPLLSCVTIDIFRSMPPETAFTSYLEPASWKDGLTIFGITLRGNFDPLINPRLIRRIVETLGCPIRFNSPHSARQPRSQPFILLGLSPISAFLCI